MLLFVELCYPSIDVYYTSNADTCWASIADVCWTRIADVCWASVCWASIAVVCLASVCWASIVDVCWASVCWASIADVSWANITAANLWSLISSIFMRYLVMQSCLINKLHTLTEYTMSFERRNAFRYNEWYLMCRDHTWYTFTQEPYIHCATILLVLGVFWVVWSLGFTSWNWLSAFKAIWPYLCAPRYGLFIPLWYKRTHFLSLSPLLDQAIASLR